jgi:predicted Zn-dependent protease
MLRAHPGLAAGGKTTTRTVRQLVLVGFLIVPSVLAAERPFYTRKDISNPDKIGHRAVAQKSIISPEKEIAIGKQFAAEVAKEVQFVRDPSVEGYVTAVAGNVARNSDWKGAVTVKVVRSSDLNSFSLPAGQIYLTSGLLLAAENEDEIAGSIAHHVAHAAMRTWASEVTRGQIMQVAMIPLIYAPSNSAACSGFLASRHLSFGVPMAFLKFSRQAELEADYLGLQYMYKAGYDPRVYVALLRKFASKDTAYQNPKDPFQERPPFSQRIAQAEQEISKILPNPPSPAKPSPEFVLVKSRLKDLAQPPAPVQPPEGRPTLRRAPVHDDPTAW